MHRMSAIASCLLASVIVSSSAFAQQLPSHGASAAGQAPTLVSPDGYKSAPYAAWQNDFGLEINYIPSPDDDRFDDGLGVGASINFPLQSYMAFRLGGSYETMNGADGFDDADVIPLGFSLLLGPANESPVSVGLELGLRYNLIDYADAGGEYDDGFGGIAGAVLAFGGTSGFGTELGLGYRFDIMECENDAGDELSLEGFALRLAFRFSY